MKEMDIQIKREKYHKEIRQSKKQQYRLDCISNNQMKIANMYSNYIQNLNIPLRELIKIPVIIQPATHHNLIVAQGQFITFLQHYQSKLNNQNIAPFLNLILSIIRLIEDIKPIIKISQFMYRVIQSFEISVQWIKIFCQVSQKSSIIRDKMIITFSNKILNSMHIKDVNQLFISILQSLLYDKIKQKQIAGTITKYYLSILEKYRESHLKQYIRTYIYYLKSIQIDIWKEFILDSPILEDLNSIMSNNELVNDTLEFLSLIVGCVKLQDQILTIIIKNIETYRRQISITKLSKLLINSFNYQPNFQLCKRLNDQSLYPNLIQYFSDTKSPLSRSDQRGLIRLFYHLTIQDYICNWLNNSISQKFKVMMEDESYQMDILDILIYLTNKTQDSTSSILRRNRWIYFLTQLLMKSENDQIIVSCDVLIQTLQKDEQQSYNKDY